MQRNGFTLVELSVVLIIVGLLAGLIVVGRDLIEASIHRRVIGQIEQVRVAVTTFRLQYGELPGDTARGSEFWPDEDVTDGDNDGAIYGNESTEFENYNVWHHLSLAGLIDGPFRNRTAVPSDNDPSASFASAMNGVYLHLSFDEPSGFNALARSGNYITLYTSPVGGSFYHFAFIYSWPHLSDKFSYGLLPSVAQWIDAKLDDGLPLSGSVRSVAKPALGFPAISCPQSDGSNAYNTDAPAGRGICGLWVELH